MDKYQPTPKEMYEAENMMSEEQREQSEKMELERISEIKKQMVEIIDSSGLNALKKLFEKSELDVNSFVEILSRTDIDKFTVVQNYGEYRAEVVGLVQTYKKKPIPESPIRVFLDDPLRSYDYKDTAVGPLSGREFKVTRTKHELIKDSSSLLGKCPRQTEILTKNEVFNGIITDMKDKWEIRSDNTTHEIRIVFDRK